MSRVILGPQRPHMLKGLSSVRPTGHRTETPAILEDGRGPAGVWKEEVSGRWEVNK